MAIAQPKSAPVVHFVKINEIKMAKWNPSRRVSEKRLIQLRLSMDDLGLYYPVLIDKNKNLVDGHRRLAIAKSFGWTHIPAITVDEGHLESYGSVQLTQQKLTANDMLGVYLVEPRALMGEQRKRIERVEKECGTPIIRRIYDAGMSASSIYDTAKRVAKYTGRTNGQFVPIVEWIVKHRLGGILNALIKGGIPATELTKAIDKDKPIVLN